MIKSTFDILSDIEDLYDTQTKELVIKNAIEGVPNYPVQLLIDSINGELIRLYMPYTIEDLLRNDENHAWKVEDDLYPSRLNWNEKVYYDARGEAVYQRLLEPFKEANVFFPSTLKTALELFKIDYSDQWELSYYRDWLIGINKSFYPHECKAIMQNLLKLSVK